MATFSSPSAVAPSSDSSLSGNSAHVANVAVVLMTVVVVVAASWLAMARGATLRRSEAIVLVLVYAACLPLVNR